MNRKRPVDEEEKKGIIGERAVRNALLNYRFQDYWYNRENMKETYQQGGGLDARRELVYYSVYSTRDKKELQTMEIDLVEEWMYADDKIPHKKAHEVKGEFASIQYYDKKPCDITDTFKPLVFNYELTPRTRNRSGTRGGYVVQGMSALRRYRTTRKKKRDMLTFSEIRRSN